MGLSWNRGYPQIIQFNGISPYKPSILGTPISGKPHIDSWTIRGLDLRPGHVDGAARGHGGAEEQQAVPRSGRTCQKNEEILWINVT